MEFKLLVGQTVGWREYDWKKKSIYHMPWLIKLKFDSKLNWNW